MVHAYYLVLFISLCCPHDAGFRLCENCKGTIITLSQRWSHVQLYGPLHVNLLPGATRHPSLISYARLPIHSNASQNMEVLFTF